MRRWRLTWGEKSWTADDLTGRHLVLIAEARGVDDWDFDPSQGPVRLLAVLAACLAVAHGLPLVAVAAVLQSAPAAALLSALSFDEEAGDVDGN